MKVRKLEQEDISQVMELLAACAPYVMPHHEYTYWMKYRYFNETCFVMEEQDKLVGYVSALPAAGHRCLFIWQIAVDSRYRGRGIGRQLLEQVRQAAVTLGYQSLQCSIDDNNQSSQKLFEKFAQSYQTELKKVDVYENKTVKESVYEIRI